MSETGVTLTLVDCTNTLLREIADGSLKQRDIAQTYHLARVAETRGEAVDWGRVNRAIITRWSRSGLERVKQMAHSGRCWREKAP